MENETTALKRQLSTKEITALKGQLSVKAITALKGQLSVKAIEGLKAKHGEIFSIECDGCICYMKKPDRRILSSAMQLSQKDASKFNEVVFTNCWLGGYDGFKDYDGELFMAAEPKLADLMERKTASLKKL